MIQPEHLVGAEWYRLTSVQRWLESEKRWHTYPTLGGSLDPESDTQSPFFDARARRVRALLMGGQACVFYGAAEFSRDTDLAIVPDAANLARLRSALDDLSAEVIAVPPCQIHLACPLNQGSLTTSVCRVHKIIYLPFEEISVLSLDNFHFR
ncbi:MAG: hypothetical protein JWR19_4420 [Pedosphaera sp.]|nr:hypothetical protein [Pedosphaera sp.]